MVLGISWSDGMAIIVIGGAILAIGVTFLKTKFISKEDCLELQRKCNNNVCADIGEIKQMISEDRIQRSAEMKNISEHMGAVKQYMKEHNGKS